MNTDKFFYELMLEASIRDAKRKFNQDIKKPFEVLVNVIAITPFGIITEPSFKVCNN